MRADIAQLLSDALPIFAPGRRGDDGRGRLVGLPYTRRADAMRLATRGRWSRSSHSGGRRGVAALAERACGDRACRRRAEWHFLAAIDAFKVFRLVIRHIILLVQTAEVVVAGRLGRGRAGRRVRSCLLICGSQRRAKAFFAVHLLKAIHKDAGGSREGFNAIQGCSRTSRVTGG